MLAWIVPLLYLSQSGQSFSTPLVGAHQLLMETRAEAAAPSSSNPLSKVDTEIAEFKKTSAGLSTAEAASGWLRILADWQAQPADNDHPFEKVVEALPRPETWPLIRAAIAKGDDSKPNRVLRMLFDLLLGNDGAVVQACEDFRKGFPPQPEGIDIIASSIGAIETPLALRLGRPNLVVPDLITESSDSTAFFNQGFPNIIGLVGPRDARQVLTRMLENAQGSFDRFSDPQIASLARSVMLSDLSHMKGPQWDLARLPGSRPYVSALVGKFGVQTFQGSDSQKGIAPWIYASTLLDQKKTDEAIALLSKETGYWAYSPSDMNLSRASYGKFFDQLSGVLENQPQLDIWSFYASVGLMAGKTSETFQRLNSAIAGSKVKPDQRQKLLIIRAELEEETGDAKAAFADFLAALKGAKDAAAQEDPAWRIVSLAKLLDNQDALTAAYRAYGSKDTSEMLGFFSAFLAQGRLADAQKYILNYEDNLRQPIQEDFGSSPNGFANDAQLPVQVAELYYKANEPAQIVDLLNDYPAWSSDDLFDVLTSGCGCQRPDGYIGFLAAWAFAKTGHKDLAIKTLHDFLPDVHLTDDGFKLLNQLEGEGALSFYDRLMRADPYSARPLIWKADLLRSLGRLRLAEQAARRAISIDPLDGAWGVADRDVVYEVLAKVLGTEGKPAEAARCERVYRAAQVGQKAYDCRSTLDYSRELALYRQAVALNPNDCVIQFQIGDLLWSLGREDESFSHYRKGYELLAEDAGEKCSLSLVNELGFYGETFANIGISVFEKQVREHSRRPQVHYLLGLALRACGRNSEALKCFEDAVRLDPNYLDAWDRIVDLGDAYIPTAAELEEAEFQVMRLDLSEPGLSTAYITDYSRLWKFLRKRERNLPAVAHGPLYPLHKGAVVSQGIRYAEGVGDALVRGASAALAQTAEVSAICSLYSQVR